MAKKEVRKIGPLTEGKKEIIAKLIEEYDIETATDIQDAIADLLGGTIKGMMEAEMSNHLGYEKSRRSDSDNARNGYKSKKVRSSYGEFDIDVPQDRNSTFEPRIVNKRQKDISEIDRKIIAMYGRGLTTRQISEQITIEDVGNVAAFLMSDLAAGVTAEITYVDGGFSQTAGLSVDMV